MPTEVYHILWECPTCGRLEKAMLIPSLINGPIMPPYCRGDYQPGIYSLMGGSPPSGNRHDGHTMHPAHIEREIREVM